MDGIRPARGGCLALFNHPDPAARGERGSAGASIAFEVDDLDRRIAELRDKGVTFTSRDVIESPVCRMATIKDSEGNSIILHQLRAR